MKKRTLSLALALALILCAMAQPALAAPLEDESQLAFTESALTLFIGDKYQLEVQTGLELAEEKLSFSSSKSSVAAVSNKGEVTAKSAGNATITVKAGGVTAVCAVTVYAAVQKVSVKESALAIKPGESVQLAPTVSPKGAQQELDYTSSNIKVATVSTEGLVKGIKEGEATITIIAANDVTATVAITVSKTAGEATPEAPAAEEEVAAKSVSVDKRNLSLEEGVSYTLQITLQPKNAVQTVSFSSSNESVATVDENGTVTAVKEGKATITVETPNKRKATCTITVKAAPISFTPGKQAAELAGLIQAARAEAGAPVYKESAVLYKAADIRAQEITEVFGNKRPNGKNCFSVLTELKIQKNVAHEFTARGYSNVSELFEDLMEDNAFAKAIKNRSYRQMAVGYAKGSDGGYWIILFIG